MNHVWKKTIAAVVVIALCASALVAVKYTQSHNAGALPVTGAPVMTTVNRATTTLRTTTTTTTTVSTTTTTAVLDVPGEKRTPGVTYFVPPSARADISYFSDVVFVGDSVTVKLMYYNIAHGDLGEAEWIASSSLGLYNSTWSLDNPDAVHPSYQGQKVTVPDGVARTGHKKVYFMLGVNDLSWSGVDKAVQNFKIVTNNILAATPDAKFYIQSVTPLYKETEQLTNNLVNAYNAAVSEYCREKGWYFLDVASVLRDDSGALPLEYCSDPDTMGIHFTDVACRQWIDFLYTHTA